MSTPPQSTRQRRPHGLPPRPENPDRGPKSRRGGPPKAKLGGPGGKTFDEMVAAGEVKPNPSSNPQPKNNHNRKASNPNRRKKQQQQSLTGVELLPTTSIKQPTMWQDGKESGLFAFQSQHEGLSTNFSTWDSSRTGAISTPPKSEYGTAGQSNSWVDPNLIGPLPPWSPFLGFEPSSIPLPLSPVSTNGTVSNYSQSDMIKDAILKKSPLRTQPTELPAAEGCHLPTEHMDGSIGDIEDQMNIGRLLPDPEATDLTDVSAAVGNEYSSTADQSSGGISFNDFPRGNWNHCGITIDSAISDIVMDSTAQVIGNVTETRRESGGSSIPGQGEEVLGEETVGIAKTLRPSGAVFVPVNSLALLKSSPDNQESPVSSFQRTSLRMTAAPFVPDKIALGLGSSTPASVKAVPLASLDRGHISTTSVARATSPGTKLKPTAPAFVPSFASPRVPTQTFVPPQSVDKSGSTANEAAQLRPGVSGFVPYVPKFMRAKGQYSDPHVSGHIPFEPPTGHGSPSSIPTLRPSATEFVPTVASVPLPSNTKAEDQRLGLSLKLTDRDSGSLSRDERDDASGLFFRQPASSATSEAVNHPPAIRPQASPMGSISAPPSNGQGGHEETKSDDGRPHRLYREPSAREEQNSHRPSFSPVPSRRIGPVVEQKTSSTSASGLTDAPRFPPGLLLSHSHPSLSQNVLDDLKDLTRSSHPFEYETTAEDMVASTPRQQKHLTISTSASSYEDQTEEVWDRTVLPSHKENEIIQDHPRLVPESPMVEDETGQLVSPMFPRPEIKIDALANDKRFREWVFPSGGPVDGANHLGHDRRPSQYRRHTMPSTTTEVPKDFQGGVASTLMERVDDLRQLLGRGVDQAEEGGSPSRQPSVEFPLRPEKKLLTVVNGDLAPPGSPMFGLEQPETGDIGGRIDKVLCMLEGLHGIVAKSPSLSRGGSPLPGDMMVDQIVRQLEHHAGILDWIRRSTQAVLVHTDDAQKRQSVLHDALLEGQEALLDRISRGLGAQEDTRHLHVQVRATQEQVSMLQEALRETTGELSMARNAVIKAYSDRDTLSVRLVRLEEESRAEKSALKAEVDDAMALVHRLSLSEREVNAQLDQLLVTNASAESERDSLADAFRTWRDKAWGYEEEIDRLRQELATATRRAEEDAKNHLVLEKNNEASVGYHEELLSRISKLDQGLHEANGSRVKEFEAVLDRNKALQGQLDSAHAKIETQAGEIAEIQLAVEGDKARFGEARATLQAQMETERSLRLASDDKIAKLEAQLVTSRKGREAALLMANERAYWARTTEVRLQTLSQENVRWRQFALESDRAKYRSYWRSNPMRDSQGEPQAPIDTRGSDTAIGQSGYRTPQPGESHCSKGNAVVEMTSLCQSSPCLVSAGGSV